MPEAPDPVFAPRGAGGDRARRWPRSGFAPASAISLYAGGISPHKNVETLIEALRGRLRAPTDRRLVARRCARRRGVPLGGRPSAGGSPSSGSASGRAARLRLRRGARLPLRGRGRSRARRRSPRASGSPPSRPPPAARRSSSATCRRTGRRSATPRSSSPRGRGALAGAAAASGRLGHAAPVARASAATVAWPGTHGTRPPSGAAGRSCTRWRVAEPLSFCMVTTFYPPYHFGGDAMHAYRLTNSLARRGHSVTVVHSEDAYRALGGRERDDPFPNEPGVTLRPLRTAFPVAAATATYVAGRPAVPRSAARRRLR